MYHACCIDFKQETNELMDHTLLDLVVTTTIRGAIDESTTPEALEMLGATLTKQIESPLHDTQVSVAEAVGYPVWVANANAARLERCDIGSLVQRTHHWSPLGVEVDFLRTEKDGARMVFSSPKDRHIEPWIEVSARFGMIPVTTTATLDS